MRSARAHLARIEERPDALRPEAVVRAVPAEPAAEAHVQDALRIAVDLFEAEAAGAAVLEAAERRMAGSAQHRARAREARLEEQALAEGDRLELAGDAVG